MRHTFLFTGEITALEPLAWSPPGNVAPNRRSLLPRMTVLTAAGPMDGVFLGGSAIRGRYRHACADVCLERERPVTYERYLELKLGGVKGSGEGKRVDLREQSAFLEREPLLSLFGAGASAIGWIHGRADVGAARPVEPVEPVVLNGRRGDAALDSILIDVLDEAEYDRVRLAVEANHRRSLAAAEVRARKHDVARAVRTGEDDAAPRLELERALRNETEAANAQAELAGSDVSMLLPLPGYEAMPAGTVLEHRMVFFHVSAGEMAVFMAGLRRFAQDPRFGAHRAHGCGRVAVEYAAKRIDGVDARPVGEVSIDPGRWDADGSSLALEGEPERWLGEWHDAPPSP